MPYHYTTGADAPCSGANNVNTFEFYRFRFHFRALTELTFGSAAANRLRGVFGAALRQTAGQEEYRRLFEPGNALAKSPSGLADWPRPFVFRAAHLENAIPRTGDPFFVDVHVFDPVDPRLGLFRNALACMAEHGIGPGRGRAELERAEQLDCEDRSLSSGEVPGPPSVIPLAGGCNCSQVRVRFVTPTELKWEGNPVERPEFAILFARLRDRIATLRALYGAGPLDLDFSGWGERAARVRLARCDLRYRAAYRISGRTGQKHPLGGFTGEVEYEGELGEFLPWLRAARWVGVGRQTVWGKGDLRVLP